MTTELATLMIIIGLVTGITGSFIGFYRAKSTMAATMASYITKKDCVDCSVKAAVKESAQDLKEGREMFEEIRIDIALIKQKLNIETPA